MFAFKSKSSRNPSWAPTKSSFTEFKSQCRSWVTNVWVQLTKKILNHKSESAELSESQIPSALNLCYWKSWHTNEKRSTLNNDTRLYLMVTFQKPHKLKIHCSCEFLYIFMHNDINISAFSRKKKASATTRLGSVKLEQIIYPKLKGYLYNIHADFICSLRHTIRSFLDTFSSLK